LESEGKGIGWQGSHAPHLPPGMDQSPARLGGCFAGFCQQPRMPRLPISDRRQRSSMTKNAARHPLALTLPAVEVPVTICVLVYGPHAALAKRLLSSIYTHTDPRLFHLRAGMNE